MISRSAHRRVLRGTQIIVLIVVVACLLVACMPQTYYLVFGELRKADRSFDQEFADENIRVTLRGSAIYNGCVAYELRLFTQVRSSSRLDTLLVYMDSVEVWHGDRRMSLTELAPAPRDHDPSRGQYAFGSEFSCDLDTSKLFHDTDRVEVTKIKIYLNKAVLLNGRPVELDTVVAWERKSGRIKCGKMTFAALSPRAQARSN